MIKKLKKAHQKVSQKNTGILVLENKKIFKGIGIGYQGEATGEVCFNTSLTGYQEIISDPSYAGQIINFTFPHIGNVGTNKDDFESDRIWTKGVIFNSEITSPSNYRSFQHLDSWLKKNKIVGITGLDTRSLTNFIRDKGAPKGTIAYSKKGKFNGKKINTMSLAVFIDYKKELSKLTANKQYKEIPPFAWGWGYSTEVDQTNFVAELQAIKKCYKDVKMKKFRTEDGQCIIDITHLSVWLCL